MNEELHEKQAELLRDMFDDGAYHEFSIGLRGKAVAEFRRAAVVRRIRRTAYSIAGTLASVILTLVIVRPDTLPERHPQGAAGLPEKAAPEAESKSVAMRTISDKEIIACFPPGSCFMAEVDGKRVLVFPDPVLRERYLH